MVDPLLAPPGFVRAVVDRCSQGEEPAGRQAPGSVQERVADSKKDEKTGLSRTLVCSQ